MVKRRPKAPKRAALAGKSRSAAAPTKASATRSAGKKPPKSAAPDDAGWSDINLRRTVVVGHLMSTAPGKKALNQAIGRADGDGDEGGYDFNPKLLAFLDEYSLQPAALAAVHVFPPPLDWAALYQKMIPYWDGEDDPLEVATWDDLCKLVNLKTLSAGDAWPSPEVLEACPSLQELKLGLNILDKKVPKRLASLCQAAGFAPVRLEGHWMVLERGTWTTASSHLAELLYVNNFYSRNNRGMFLNVESARFAGGALLATLRTNLDEVELKSEVTLLAASAAKTANATAVKDALAGVAKHVFANTALPSA